MNAGRELDKLVAKEIFGIDIAGQNINSFAQQGLVGIKPYSTDIAAAWEVLEFLKDVGFVIKRQKNDFSKDFSWQVTIGELFDFEVERQAEGMWDIPRAICLAALEFKGVEL